jgi:hypothetical protein
MFVMCMTQLEDRQTEQRVNVTLSQPRKHACVGPYRQTFRVLRIGHHAESSNGQK